MPTQLVVLFHLAFNVVVSVGFIGLTGGWRASDRLLPSTPSRVTAPATAAPGPVGAVDADARHLERRARGAAPGRIVETMLIGMLDVIRNNDLRLAAELRKLDDTVDELYSAIKYYLTKISREALGEDESRRWTDIISFTINMEQIGDIIERVISTSRTRRSSRSATSRRPAWPRSSSCTQRLVANLRLGMSVFLNGNVRDAQKLLEEKARFRDLERAYATTHLGRLADQHGAQHGNQLAAHRPDQRPEANQLAHLLDRLSDPRSAGALAPTRMRESRGRPH